MKSKLLLFLLLMSATFAKAQDNPFDSLKFDKVMAYEFQGDGGRMIDYCLKKETGRIADSIKLSTVQINKLENLLISNSTYGNSTASCFDPHLAVVYYKNNAIIGTVNICLGCNYLTTSIAIPATQFKTIKVSDDYSYAANGFSKDARKAIHSFCKEIGFTKFLKPLNSMFDQ